MGAFFACSIQSALCLALFYLFYKILLSRDTFHRFNRGALLSILVLAWMIPIVLTFISTHDLFAAKASANMLPDEELDLMAGIFPTGGYAADDRNTTMKGLLSVLLWIYLAGCVVCLLYMMLSSIHIVRIIRKGECVAHDNGIRLILLNDPHASFSWMNYVVISRFDYEEAGETILAHEKAHIRLRHSFDLIIAQICIVTQWFNPAAWLLYEELHHIHEFEADEAVLRQGINTRQYQLLLIKKAVGTRLYSMANSFNHSNLKKRITMMLQKKSNAWARLKYAYVLPLAATTLVVFAHPEISQSFEEISKAKINHFALITSTNEVENLPEAALPAFEGAANQSAPQFTTTASTENPGISGMNVHAPRPTFSDTMIYETAEVMPAFPGGETALLKYVSDHLVYPTEAAENGIQGRIPCLFVVEKDGSISNIHIKTPLHPLLDKEALRVIKSLPKFAPGTNKGKPVRVRYSLPVRFRLYKPENDGTPTSSPSPAADQSTSAEAPHPDSFVYRAVENMPRFPGGEVELLNYIKNHIQYPEQSIKDGSEGRVACTFIVEADGSISNVTVVRPIDPLLDKEAMRVLQTLPKFTPGTHKGKVVRVLYAVPVRFQLPKGTNSETTPATT